MRIIETSIFTRRLKSLLGDDEYRELQNSIVVSPDSGKIIKGGGGIRKLRWSGSGRGKRGGVRVIYYWYKNEDIVLMLLIYAKNEKDGLSPAQLKMLRTIVEQELL
jgi:mRNA-degrading endonuclease RelE of RelBE toxin-antitoxin system